MNYVICDFTWNKWVVNDIMYQNGFVLGKEVLNV